MKEGYKTTEFWNNLIIQVLGIVVLLGGISPDASSEVADIGTKGVALIAQAISAYGYSKSRGSAKKNAVK